MTSQAFWWLLGLVALIAEFLTGTFYLLVLAAAFAAGGLAALAGMEGIAQAVCASAAGLASLVVVRRLKRRLGPSDPVADDPDIGQPVTLISEHDGLWRVAYRGTQWDARFTGEPPGPDETALIAGREGNRLLLTTHPTGQH
ncbi:NfeD family protein [Paludibacterium paludis]|uniref:NfeD-like C-terminal domain-containing protein n=1 Tax=Paludibacterium paludis TaxID=1225769 RepID=A0A918P5U1_9NEIS|nr:NfeD family protein [Paludibacterium paludis]GGY23095.1 hypothetical protein GCM10011289_28570 [Paludibacterium paludis]